MSVGFVSTLASRETLRLSIVKAQAQVDRASSEVASGRHYDVGLALGIEAGQTLDLRQLSGEVDTLRGTNALATSRLQSTQSALAEMTDLANGLFSVATTAIASGIDRSVFIDGARLSLRTLTGLLSTTSGGAHLFSGSNTSVAPLDDYLANPPGIARTAVVGSFTSTFGFGPDDPRVAAITPLEIHAYLDGAFAGLLADPQWSATFSAASDVPMRQRIAQHEVIETSVSANSPGIRKLFGALVAVIDTGSSSLNAASFSRLASRVAEAAATAATDLAESQSQVGNIQERLAKADDRLALQRQLLEKDIGGLEGVDAADAITRLSQLTSRLETTYKLTARLQNLSLLAFL